MTGRTDDLTPSEAVLVSYSKELEGAADPDAVFRRYAAAHPDLAADLEHLLRVRRAAQADGPAAPSQALLTPGDRLGAFRVRRFVARGGMGEVYEATQDDLDRRVALKVSARPFEAESALEQFRRERQVPAQVHQTHVVPVHAAGEAEVRGVRVWYYAMHFIDGVSLAAALTEIYRRETSHPGGHDTPPLHQLVGAMLPPAEPSAAAATHVPATTPAGSGAARRAGGRLRVRLSMAYFASVARTMAEVGEAVGHLHARGIRHRDVKPSNVMMDRGGTSYLIDFGLAHQANGKPATEHAAPPPDPPGGGYRPVEPGTLEYMAPEQYAGPGHAPGPIDQRADVYGLGVTLYELFTLRPAFADPDRQNVPARVVAGRPTPPRELVEFVPPDLEAVFRKATDRDPARRYPTAGAFAADLRRWCGWRPTTARPGWATLRPLRLWAWRHKALAVAALAIVALVSGAVAWVIREGERAAAEATRVANQEREEREQLQKQHAYEQAVLDSQRIRLGTPYVGWSRDAWRKLEDARDIRPDADLRDHAAATLAGLDARHVLVANWLKPEAIVGLSGVAFGPDGRLLAGGWMATRRDGVSTSPALLWDANQARKPAAATEPGEGPVAFPDAESPLHLILPTGARWDLLLWNVGTDTKVAEFPLPGREAETVTAALSADARFAAGSVVTPRGQGERPGTTVLWSLDRRQPGGAVKEVARWEQFSSGLAFSPDGRFLAAGSEKGEVVVRSTADGAVVRSFAEIELPVTALGFGRNFWRAGGEKPRPADGVAGWLLAVASKGSSLAVWNLETRRRVNSYHGSHYDVHAVAFSTDGATLASAGRDVPILWDVATGRRVMHLRTSPDGTLRSWMPGIAFSADGRRVAVTGVAAHGYASGLDVFELDDGRGVRTYRGLAGAVSKVWIAPSGRLVAGLAENWQLGVWERDSGRLLHVWDVSAGWFADNAALAFDEKRGDVLFASGTSATRWSLASGDKSDRWELPLGLNDNLAIPNRGEPILFRRDMEGPFLWGKLRPPMAYRCRELGAGGMARELYTLPDVTGSGFSTSLSSDGRYLLHNERRGEVVIPRLFHGMTGKEVPIRDIVPFGKSIRGFLSERGSTLVVSDVDKPTRTSLYRLPDLKRIGEHGIGLDVDDEGKLGVKSEPPGRSLYRVGEDRPLVTFDLERQPSNVDQRMTGDGRLVGWGRADGTVCVADVNRCLEQLTPFPRR